MPVRFATESSSSSASKGKLFGRERSIHEVLGGGKAADVLLWRNRNISAGLLLGISVIWFLFEVVEYNFITLLCHLSIAIMLVFFIWCTGAETFGWNPPILPQIIVREDAFKDAALTFHRRFNHSLSKLFDIAYGRDLPHFILAIVSLYTLSVIGTYFSFLNFLYVGFLCLHILPIVYERFEDDIDRLVGHVILEMKKLYMRFDTNFLDKIPRGTVKEKKLR
ncbi:reticulon-like protein B9 [Ziziphus jujuba]|uniref:Reticulon-like protein n=1 Tax=Ziziphus jujuba TaxID=326968 RepID=A0ABM3IK73_ZIZJJ|nr:reticulon-like protein B9 [Ziziphus jujuba]